MLKSMTGFGRGECIWYERKFKVELKSVNHRFSDFSIKLPRFLNPFEDSIRHRLAIDIIRGKVDVWINFESFRPEDTKIQVNEAYADMYMKALWGISKRYGLGEVPLATLLEMLAKSPDVIVSDRYENAIKSDTARNEIWEGLFEALGQALYQYNYMREMEGASIKKDIEEKCAYLTDVISKIRERLPHAIEEHATKLKERIRDLTEKLSEKFDETRVITEIAVLADKSDINEEMTRLESHLEQLTSMMNEEGAKGRKMDFLIQELNREANTIGAKSTDIHLTKYVVELKSSIEQIREQIQNVE
ncbi:MAG: YicC family protein [Clostridiales bacterium]|jgi:uncharacterized protein (TIGR00255 family)|nr:YicC family protein [Clostridiales bacterium]